MGKISIITQIDILKFIKWNYFKSNVVRDKGKYLIPYRHAVIDIDKNAKVELHGNIYVNPREIKGSKKEAFLFIRQNGKLVVNDSVRLLSGAILQVQQDASIEIGKAYINHDATIIAANNMKIGNGILISRNVTIFDSDFHKILDKDGNQSNSPHDVEIGDHVWIGVNATILRGTKIEEGAVVAAGAVVGGKIKGGTMAAGNPARSYSEIQWEE